MVHMLYLRPARVSPQDEAVARAATILLAGGIVAFPTETVYGLGACFNDISAVRKIFLAKGRPADNPLIAHIADRASLSLLAASTPAIGQLLMEAFWPGPLTVVVPRTRLVPDIVTGGLDTVGVRMPAHPLALALIEATGVPLVAPSANRSGRPSPTSAAHVEKDLGASIEALLDGGETEVGLESTVVGFAGADEVVVFRPGAVTEEMIRGVLGPAVRVSQAEYEQSPPSPGMKYAHYSPDAEIWLLGPSAMADIGAYVGRALADGERVGVLAFDDTLSRLTTPIARLSLGNRGDLAEAGHVLYGQLRLADEADLTLILVEAVPETGLGRALMNRLRKAATRVLEV